MTISCTDCRTCGDCYPKIQDCAKCGKQIVLDQMDECPNCGEPITDEMRLAARRAFMQHKKEEFEMLFPRKIPGLDR